MRLWTKFGSKLAYILNSEQLKVTRNSWVELIRFHTRGECDCESGYPSDHILTLICLISAFLPKVVLFLTDSSWKRQNGMNEEMRFLERSVALFFSTCQIGLWRRDAVERLGLAGLLKYRISTSPRQISALHNFTDLFQSPQIKQHRKL